MYKVTNISSDAYQKQSVVLSDGSSFDITMYYCDQQFGWFITELKYNQITINGMRINVSPNMLHQLRNKLPFGLACFTNDNTEPMLIEDFSSGKATLYVLSAEEVAEYAAYLTNG